MSEYKRRVINIDKLSSYVRLTGICTEEAALHLMDEIMFLRADLNELREWNATCLQNNAELESRNNELAEPERIMHFLDGRENAIEEAAQLMEIQSQWVDSPDELAAKIRNLAE